MNSYYQSHLVWKRINEHSVVRYFCWYDLVRRKYAVQNADFFYSPISIQELSGSDKNSAELFMDIDPAERCDWFDDILEAIKNHEIKFDM